MKLSIAFEILFLVLIASLSCEFVAGQSVLSLDLHKQSQRTKQAAPVVEPLSPPASLLRLRRSQEEERSAEADEAFAATIGDSARASTQSSSGLDDESQRWSSSDSSSSSSSNASPSPSRQEAAPTPAPRESAGGDGAASQRPSEGLEEASSTPSSTTTRQPSQELAPAELCYLANGASSLTLTVNEATQVGAPIGSLEVSQKAVAGASLAAWPTTEQLKLAEFL